MRVLHCRAPQIFGGPERQIIGLMKNDSALGISQELLLIDRRGAQAGLVAEEARRRGLAVHVTESRGRTDLRPFCKLQAMTIRGDFDVLCTHGYLPDIYGFFAARRHGRRIVAVAHGYTGKSRSVRAYEWADSRLLRRFDHVVAVSNALRERLARSGVRPARVTTIHNAVDMADPLERGEARKRLGLPAEGFVVGSVGRLSPEKGHRFLVEAIADLVGQGCSLRAVVCGDGPERQELESLIRRLGVGEQVALVGIRADVEAVLSAFDAFVLPSLTEGIPVALLEAAAAGRACVASAVGGVPEVLSDGDTGLLVPAADSARMAAAIKGLHDDPALAQRLGEAARARVSREFSRQVQVSRYREVFAGLGASSPSRGCA